MKVYAVEVEYEQIKMKAKTANRLAKSKRGCSSSIAEYTTNNLILDKLDDIESSIEQNAKCCKRLHDLDRALVATFKCTICLNTMPVLGIEYAG